MELIERLTKMVLFNNSDTLERVYTSKEFDLLDGYIPEDIARVTLAKFLYNNISLTCELLLGIKLFPFQEIILRGWFDKNFSMMVASRGASKSWLSAVYCCLYPIFFPETRIVISSNSFRSTRRIVQQVERFINNKKAPLLRQCFTSRTGKLEFQRRSDEFMLECNGGTIVALPLNEKIRGTRADILICDEFLQLSEDTFKSVLLPFLTAKSDIQNRMELEEELSLLDLKGYTSEEKDMLEANKKLIALTSASYDFEFCY